MNINRHLTELRNYSYFHRHKCLIVNLLNKYIRMISHIVLDGGPRCGRTANARCSKHKYSIVYNGSETSVGHISRAPTPMRHNTNTKEHVAFLRARQPRGLEKEERGTWRRIAQNIFVESPSRQAAFNIFDKVCAFESVDAKLVNPRL